MVATSSTSDQAGGGVLNRLQPVHQSFRDAKEYTPQWSYQLPHIYDRLFAVATSSGKQKLFQGRQQVQWISKQRLKFDKQIPSLFRVFTNLISHARILPPRSCFVVNCCRLNTGIIFSAGPTCRAMHTMYLPLAAPSTQHIPLYLPSVNLDVFDGMHFTYLVAVTKLFTLSDKYLFTSFF